MKNKRLQSEAILWKTVADRQGKEIDRLHDEIHDLEDELRAMIDYVHESKRDLDYVIMVGEDTLKKGTSAQ